MVIPVFPPYKPKQPEKKYFLTPLFLFSFTSNPPDPDVSIFRLYAELDPIILGSKPPLSITGLLKKPLNWPPYFHFHCSID